MDPQAIPTPAEFEQAFLPWPDREDPSPWTGQPMARFGLRMSFFFRRLGEPDTRQTLLRLLEQYLQTAGNRIRIYTFSGNKRPRTVPAGQTLDLAPLRAQLTKQDFHWDVSGSEANIADHWSMCCRSGLINYTDFELGYLLVHLPFTALEGAPPGSFRTLFRTWCAALAVEHAYAGMGFVLPVAVGSLDSALRRIGQEAMRFVGLDVENPSFTSIKCREGIRCVNWLTAVSHRLLDRVGGSQNVAAAAGPNIVVHDYGYGSIFQAGALPQIGDATRNLIPADYVAIGRALKPLRANYTTSIFRAPPGYEAPPGENPNYHFSQRWLARFDG